MAAFTAKIGAWIYPGSPADTAQAEYQDGRVLYMLKPEYYSVVSGALVLRTVATDGVNGYTAANAADVRKYSQKQFCTVSCGTGAVMDVLCSNSTNRTNAINTLVSFCQTNQFTGVELDWEGYSGWTTTHYTNFITFVTALSSSLHSNGFQLMIDGPPITAITDSVNGQNLYKFKYEDLNSIADFLCVLAYDKQYDYGGGTSIAPNLFVQQVCDWMIAKVTDVNKIIVGMPSYGYAASDGLYNLNIKTKAQVSPTTGYGTATRNADSEMNWQNTPAINATTTIASAATSCTLASSWGLASGQYTVTFSNGNVRVASVTKSSTSCTWSTGLTTSATSSLTWTAVDTFYQDSIGLNAKRDLIEAKGIKHVSVWHLGGNDWFTVKTEPTAPSSITNLSSISNLSTITF